MSRSGKARSPDRCGVPPDGLDLEEFEEEEEEDVGDAGDVDLQVAQQARLAFLHSELTVEASRRRSQEMEAAEEAEMLAYMDEVEQEEDEPEPSYPPVQPAPGTVVVDISVDEE